jgi:hypothetical protein
MVLPNDDVKPAQKESLPRARMPVSAKHASKVQTKPSRYEAVSNENDLFPIVLVHNRTAIERLGVMAVGWTAILQAGTQAFRIKINKNAARRLNCTCPERQDVATAGDSRRFTIGRPPRN